MSEIITEIKEADRLYFYPITNPRIGWWEGLVLGVVIGAFFGMIVTLSYAPRC